MRVENMLSEGKIILKNYVYTFAMSTKNQMQRGRKHHVAEQKGTGRPYRSSVGKSGMEAHFLNEGIPLMSAGDYSNVPLQPEHAVARILENELVFPFPLWFLPQCHTMPAVIQGNLLLLQSTWV